MKHKSSSKRQIIRIVAGDFRHRHIHFVEAPDLRPTGARIRETLFNWLHPVIYGKTCLDLFAGSGILGFEALSRGAKHVTFVEKNRRAAQQIAQNIKQLSIDNATVRPGDYRQALSGQYDIIFLDPPYALRLLPILIEQVKPLSPEWLFIEDNRPIEDWLKHRTDYKLHRHKKAGHIYYGLLRAGRPSKYNRRTSSTLNHSVGLSKASNH